jgi:penicillin amidase
MADIDANQLTLLGGQDGWWGSDTMLDQLDPWRRHEAVQVPLSPEAVARGFHHKTPLLP